MVSSIKRLLSFLNRMGRFAIERFGLLVALQPLALGLVVLTLVVNMESSSASPSNSENSPAELSRRPRQHQVETPPLPLSAPVRARLHQHLATKAALTGHSLTAAHFFGQPSNLAAEIRKAPEQG